MPIRWATLFVAAALAATGALAQPTAGKVEKVVVHGVSLEGALLDISADRDVAIYLPPSYASDPNRRYPVIYSLHGFGSPFADWAAFLGAPGSFDRAIAVGADEMIVVMPNAMTTLGGAMFSNSAATGDWESFIAEDLVAFVDANYRTLASRKSRGLTGFSMGGYGTLRIAMKRPDVFGAIYAMSACCLPPQVSPVPKPAALEGLMRLESIRTPEEAADLGFAAAPLAMAAAWSPNPDNPPLYFDVPTKNREAQPDVIAAWSANAILPMVHQYVPALRSLDAIAIDIGLQDGLLSDNERLHALLDAYGIDHGFETYEGGHGDRIAERVETHVLPFFTEHLTFAAPRDTE